MLLLGGLCVQSCLFGVLLIPETSWASSRPHSQVARCTPDDHLSECDPKPNVGIASRITTKITKILHVLFDKDILCDIKFILFFINNTMWNFGSLVILMMVSDYAVTSGLSKDRAALAVSTIGFTGVLARVMAGFIGNCSCTKIVLFYNIVTVCSGICVWMVGISSDYIYVLCCCACYGYFFGSQTGVLAITTTELFGAEKLTQAFGYIMLSHGLGALSGPPVAGAIYDRTKSYYAAFVFGGVVTLVGACLGFSIQLIRLCTESPIKRELVLQVDVKEDACEIRQTKCAKTDSYK